MARRYCQGLETPVVILPLLFHLNGKIHPVVLFLVWQSLCSVFKRFLRKELPVTWLCFALQCSQTFNTFITAELSQCTQCPYYQQLCLPVNNCSGGAVILIHLQWSDLSANGTIQYMLKLLRCAVHLRYLYLCLVQCCGSGMFIPDPDFCPSPRSRFSDPDPGSKNSNKREEWKIVCCPSFFVATDITKLKKKKKWQIFIEF